MNAPLISISIPTYNSEATLQNTLESIRKQKYPQSKIEIIIIDGGSKDQTIKIAKRFKCKIIANKKTDIIYAKHLGYINAKGKYLINIDSDESFANINSFINRIKTFNSNPQIKAILLSGYLSPKNGHPINDYINEFGDPFSYFLYRQSKGYKYLITDLEKTYYKLIDNQLFTVFRFEDKPLPLIELWAGGCMVDLEYLKKTFKNINSKPFLVAHLFYLINSKNKLLAVMKNDPTIHNSTPSFKRYLKKITSRIKNNIFSTAMGKSGYLGRDILTQNQNQYKKYLFILYAFSIIFPLFDSIHLAVNRKKIIYLNHFYLTLYTASLILFYFTLKKLHIPVHLGNYGN